MNRQHWKELLPIITAFANGERVEMVDMHGKVIEADGFTFDCSPEYYRIAPRTIRIGKYDVPEPYRGEMKEDQEYYVADPETDQFHRLSSWNNDGVDETRMKRGLVHLTPEAAALHGKALASLTAGEGVEL